MKKIEDRLDKIDDKLESIDKTLALQEANLAEHMRRTELLEIQNEKLIKEELAPIKEHVNQLKGGAKLIALLALMASVYMAIKM